MVYEVVNSIAGKTPFSPVSESSTVLLSKESSVKKSSPVLLSKESSI